MSVCFFCALMIEIASENLEYYEEWVIFAAPISKHRKQKRIITLSGRIAQNYRKIKSKNYKKNGTRLVTAFLDHLLLIIFYINFLIILSEATNKQGCYVNCN